MQIELYVHCAQGSNDIRKVLQLFTTGVCGSNSIIAVDSACDDTASCLFCTLLPFERSVNPIYAFRKSP